MISHDFKELLMEFTRVIEKELAARVSIDQLTIFTTPCRPRLLIVTDSSLNFLPTSGFGLWRFLHGITLASGVTNKPIITLAYRGVHPGGTNVTVGTDVYTVINNFNFSTSTPAVNLTNYDQIWMFGFNTVALTNAEIGVVADFMNSGGGVFATGDHGTLGQGMCGSLPRVRHMREWSAIPMGTETPSIAVNRIDTVINPGANNLYEFEDQSDNIPQRIFPNYKVTATGVGNNWTATVHPVLMLPGAPAVRASTDAGGGNVGFQNDMDVLPDHPHESVCKEVSTPVLLNGSYTSAGLNFSEYNFSVANGAVRTGAEIVAYGVSGGRSVFNGVWKPPVRPQMFGIISGYDGRLAQPYPTKTQRPGRVVCDSTWHHYVNINLDGMTSGRNGLGIWSGGPGIGTFTPSTDLNKIYRYYRNIISWLQPPNRIWCRIIWDLIAVRYHPFLVEELLEVPALKTWEDFVGLGMEAARLLNNEEGSEYVRETISGTLASLGEGAALGGLLERENLAHDGVDPDELYFGILGGLLAKVTTLLPLDDEKATIAILKRGVDKIMNDLIAETHNSVRSGFTAKKERAERTGKILKEREGSLKKLKL
jgi:hypothetical protein